ncbi:hypothetical protein ACHRVZ_14845 [Flavobacterium sp. FlaQc-57]|uniref:hypothetical protein n=1 Tax=Flavobacterium sp. FlaQc-57 TaxID=3374186 RepID=UPI00375744B3
MNFKIIMLLAFLLLFIQCKEEKIKKNAAKVEMISAINTYNFIGDASLKFQLFSDSSYVFTITENDLNHEKKEKFKDFCFSKNDTIYFSRTRFRYNGSEKAVIKNGFIEFIDGESPLKIEIKKNLFHTKAKLDLKKYNNYAFFTFNPEFQRPKNYGYKSGTIKPADLDQNELIELNRILKICFKENASKLKNINQYIKQCIVVLNEKQEKEVWTFCYCRDPYDKESYKYNLMMVNDGGNCNISLKVNLTKHNYTDLNISGSA